MYTITDDFSGMIEYEPNGKLWNVYSSTFSVNGGSITPFVYDGKLRFTTVRGTGSSHVYSAVLFRPFSDPNNILGNFQITLEFSEAYFEDRSGFCMRYNKTTDGKVQLQRECTSTTQRILSMNQNYGESPEYETFNTEATSGKLRIRRSGDVMYCYYDVGGGWVEISSKTFTPRPTGGTIELYGYSYSPDNGFGCVHIDNFEFKSENHTLYTISGTVTPPDDKVIYLIGAWTNYPEILEYTQANGSSGEFGFNNIWTNSQTFDVIGAGDTGEQDIIYNAVTPVSMGLTDERPGDPDSYTKLLLHSDDANDSVTVIDSSQSEHTITNNGFKHKTNLKKFGTSSLCGMNDENNMQAAASNDWALGSAYTIDLWFRQGSGYGFGNFLRQDSYPYKWWFNNGNSHLSFLYDGPDDSFNNKYEPGGYIFGTGAWYHIAVTYDGIKNRLYLNGNFVQGHTTTHSIPYWNAALAIGSGGWDGGKYLEEVRISKGIARWTTEGSFSVPTAPYNYNIF